MIRAMDFLILLENKQFEREWIQRHASGPKNAVEIWIYHWRIHTKPFRVLRLDEKSSSLHRHWQSACNAHYIVLLYHTFYFVSIQALRVRSQHSSFLKKVRRKHLMLMSLIGWCLFASSFNAAIETIKITSKPQSASIVPLDKIKQIKTPKYPAIAA